MGKISVLIVFGLQLFWTLFSSAQITDISGITHGAEFEFTNSWIYESDSPEKLGAEVTTELVWISGVSVTMLVATVRLSLLL